VVHIATDQSDQSSPPKRSLLCGLARLCNFFGRDGVMAYILPQILAFLNDRCDWQLRAALFERLASVCSIIGRAATEHFVLPCLETALVDAQDLVMGRALQCLASLVELGLLSRSVLVTPQSMHPTTGLPDKPKRYVMGKSVTLFWVSCIHF
jgi:phosphoinositide-3-kinase regulatory subunit 4